MWGRVGWGGVVRWLGGGLVPWFLGSLVPWFLGSLVPWFLGCLLPWFGLVGWCIGCLVFECVFFRTVMEADTIAPAHVHRRSVACLPAWFFVGCRCGVHILSALQGQSATHIAHGHVGSLNYQLGPMDPCQGFINGYVHYPFDQRRFVPAAVCPALN